jgi:phenylalanyl-tRNA synthetase beta chain
MRVPLSWLKDYVDVDMTPEALAHTMTMAGLEVESIEYIGQSWGDKVITAQIIHLEKVPKSDHLSYTRVTTGRSELGVICGAPNIKEGDKVPLALPGAQIGDITIGASRKMGYVSEGMLCSPRELGLGNDHAGIYILDPDTPLGVRLVDLLGEVVLDFSIKAHRGDLSSIIGIAREVSALTGKPLRLPEIVFPEQGTPASEMARIEVAAPDLCSRYSARIISNVKSGPSPSWMARRLLAAGMRPISNIVDITNYVMLEFGQPLHGFDYDLVRQHTIIVRRATEGEELTTLDDVKRKLTPEMLLITDPEGPTGLAGIMGGAISELNDATRTILLEAANFKASNVRRTSTTLGLRTDASSRFEKGLDPELTVIGANRAAQLMVELAGATVNPGIIDIYPAPITPRVLSFSTADIAWLTGLTVPQHEAVDALRALSFGVVPDENGKTMSVTVPTYRADIDESADLVEEVLRIIGYDKLPATIPTGPLPPPLSVSWFDREQEVRTLLLGAGLNEIVTYAMTSRERMVKLLAQADATSARALLQAGNVSAGISAAQEAREVREAQGTSTNGARQEVATKAAKQTKQAATALAPFDASSLPALVLANPLSSDLEAMRLTLMAGLMETLQENSKHNRAGLRFFEIGRRYLPAEDLLQLPDERRSVAIAMSGPAAISWVGELARPADFYDLKGVVETLLEGLHLTRYRFTPTQHPTFHPGRCALLELPRRAAEGEEVFSPVGVLGEVHPLVQQHYDLPERVYLCELDLAQLYAAVPARLVYSPISRHQELTRDLAIVVEQQVLAQDVHDVMMSSGGELLRSATLFDIYTGEPIPAGKKSLTYTLLYQSQERTLTDAEANTLQEKILRALHDAFGAVLR